MSPKGRSLADTVTTQEWLLVSNVEVDPAYQRDINEVRVDRMAAEFDPDAIGSIVVSRREDRDVVIDGQHRLAMMRRMGYSDQRIPATVLHGLTQAQEAHLFWMINVRSAKPTQLDNFKARLVSGDPDAVCVNTIVSSLHLRFGKHPGGSVIKAVKACEDIHTHWGNEMLSRTLRLMKGVWDVDEPNRFAGDLMLALALFMHRYNGLINMSELEEKLTRETPSHILAKARSLSDVYPQRVSRFTTYYLPTMLVVVYNKNRRGDAHKVPEWENITTSKVWSYRYTGG